MNPAEITPFWQKLVSASTRASKEGFSRVGSVGAGAVVGSDVFGATSKEVGVGYRATDFLDVQVVHETVSGGDGGTLIG